MQNSTKLFDKVITFTDIHLGLKNNSKIHNEDCVKFIKFMIETAKKHDIKTCIFMGDFFHNRSNVNISTLNYGLEIMMMLNSYFDNTYFLVGNHDMYFKNKRDVTSINMAKAFDHITFINEITTIKDCTFIPFMIDDEYQQLPMISSKYVFGHLELPGYMLNKMIPMPDHGKETDESFKCDYVFSGHFHKRQYKITSNGTKIVYTGNCFPHNFSDVWDDNRGVMILEHNGTPEYVRWDEAPKYRSLSLSNLLENPDYYLENNVVCKIQIDTRCTMDDINYIRDIFNSNYNLRDLAIVPFKENITNSLEYEETEKTESVDEIVLMQIDAIDSNTLNKELLKQIYVTL